MIKKLLFPLFLVLVSINIEAQQPYYSDVNLNLNGVSLKNELASKIISTHSNTLNYSQAREALKITDLEPGQNTNVLLLYGFSNNTCQNNSNDDNDHRLRNKNKFGGGAFCEWNREHTFAKSLGSPNLGTSGPGADAHHLRACDVQRNSSRGNKKFSVGSGNSGSSSGGWYPGDEWKGDVARMIMYMYLRYGNQCKPTQIGIGSTSNTPDDMIDLFLKWNAEDPVSEYEDQRNTYLGNTNNQYGQGNRNPFIDNPYLATRIWGGPQAEDRWGNSTTDTEVPTPPSNLQNTTLNSTSVGLSWSPATDNIGVTGYDIYVNGLLNSNINDTETTIDGLVASTEYSFYVIAKDAAGNTSTKSNTISVMTLADDGGDNSNNNNCVNESFENIPAPSSSYTTHTWTGDDNIQWTSTKSRTDQSLNQRAITIRRDGILSATNSGGISNFSVKTKRVFSGSSGTFDLIVNGNKVGEITYSENENITEINDINITGNVTISIENNSVENNRVMFDDLNWKCYATASVKENTLSDISIYPNPSNNGDIYISVPTNVSVNNIKVYSILGKEIHNTTNKPKNKIKLKNLKSGLYLLKISNKNQSLTKKIIVN